MKNDDSHELGACWRAGTITEVLSGRPGRADVWLLVAIWLVAAGCSKASPTSTATVTTTTTGSPTTAPPTTLAAPTTTTTPPPEVSAAKPCGAVPSAPRYLHVLWIWMENHSYSSIIGDSGAPYINTLAKECGLAANYHNVSHPSLPNYVAATTGLPLSGLTQFDGDCGPSTSCSTASPSIFGQGETWKAYEETMPAACSHSDAGNYAVRHNPPAYLTALSGCDTFDVPYSNLAADLTANQLPAFSFVTPNVADDMHDGTIGSGDSWLAANLAAILGSAAYESATTAVFVTWDEGEGGSSNDCATNSTDVGCHVATLVISPSTVPGTTSATLFNHYSLLATAETLLGLPRLGEAATADTMTSAFNL